jgi:hypothetical protein
MLFGSPAYREREKEREREISGKVVKDTTFNYLRKKEPIYSV